MWQIWFLFMDPVRFYRGNKILNEYFSQQPPKVVRIYNVHTTDYNVKNMCMNYQSEQSQMQQCKCFVIVWIDAL